ncbi:trigger factor [Thiobacter aerophilum]|uniref:Trigger factor n=1 Tax=Thiobacter aerophilum TaxID=3121275 RepID=A0ABV0EBW5_9BURK
MQATVENISQLERRIRITVPRTEIDSEVAVRLKRLAKTVKVHGFRPGKVPLKIVAQQYGGEVRREVIGETMERRIAEVLQAQSLRVAGYPRLESVSEQGADALEFSATFEIYPEVKLGDLSSVTIERPQVTITEADVDKTIEIMRKQRATFEPVDRPAQAGDRVEVDYRGTIDGQSFPGGEAQDYPFVLGAGRALKDFEDAILGMRPGETKTVQVSFPEDYQGRDVAGKTATFELRVKRVLEPGLPEVGPEFAKALGIEDGDVTKMRAEIRASLEREVKKRIEARLKEQVMQALLDSTPVELPRALVELEAQRLAQRMREDLAGRGFKGELPLPPEAIRESAERRVKLGLILAELVRAHDLHATPEQVKAVVEDFAQSYEQPERIVQWYYQEPGRLAEAESLALERNVVNWVLGIAQVTDKPITFDELMGIAQ